MRLTRLQQEILKNHVGPFFFCFFTVMFILLMQFLILHIDKLVGKGLAIGIVIELILTNLAYMVVLAVPMSVLVASLIAFGRFSEWNELSAVKAAGVNPIRLMTPVMVTTFLLFLGLSYFSNNILPESNHRARSLFIDIRMQKPAFDLEPGTFYTGIEGNTFLVDQVENDSDTLRNITLFR
ncbi:MAG: LptF/LptG family permease, partial [Bacteroidota bacterium]